MSDLYNNLTIDTPENVGLDAEIAGVASRCMAALIDHLIIFISFFIFVIIYLTFNVGARFNGENRMVILAISGLIFLIIIFYHMIFELMWNGQTPGKRMLGLRIVQNNGLPLTTNGALIRNFVRLIDFFPAIYAIGLIVLFATKQTQRLGDLAARTVTIRERQQMELMNIQENFRVTYHHIRAHDELPPYMTLESLNETHRREIVTYLQRRKDIFRREHIVGIIATRIAKAAGHEIILPEFRSPNAAEKYLEQLALAFEIANRGKKKG